MDGQEGRGLESFKVSFTKLSGQNAADVDAAIKLLDTQWEGAGRDIGSQFPDLYPDTKYGDARERNKNYWVAKSDRTGEVIGIAGFSEFEGDSPEHAWLGWFFVKKELQGQRYGVRLLEHIAEELRRLNKTDLYVQTSDRPTMAGNTKFYDRNDFPVVARMDTDRTIHIGPEAGDLSEDVIKTVVDVNDAQSPEKGITNFIRRRRLIVPEQ